MAIYQDPNLTTGVDIDEAGNTPTWKISGMVYLPQSSVTLSGAINKSSNGKSCFGLVVKDLLINGTGAILAQVAAARQVSTCPPALPQRAVEHWSFR